MPATTPGASLPGNIDPLRGPARELLDVLLIREAVIPQDVAAVPELLNDAHRGHWIAFTRVGIFFRAVLLRNRPIPISAHPSYS